MNTSVEKKAYMIMNKDDLDYISDRVTENVIDHFEENGYPPSAVYSVVKFIFSFLLFLMWVGGFVLAKGVVSTIACLIPFWSWYLVIEWGIMLVDKIAS